MLRVRGDQGPDAMFSYVSAEDRIPADHPLRAIRTQRGISWHNAQICKAILSSGDVCGHRHHHDCDSRHKSIAHWCSLILPKYVSCAPPNVDSAPPP
jgi:hypothetical protein